MDDDMLRLRVLSLEVLRACVRDDVDEYARAVAQIDVDPATAYMALAKTAAAALQVASDTPLATIDTMRAHPSP